MYDLSEILLGRRGIEGIQALLLGVAGEGMLLRALALVLDRHVRLSECRLQRAKYKPGRKLAAYYEVEVQPGAGRGALTRPIAVTWSPGGPAPAPALEPELEPELEAAQRGLLFPFTRLAGGVGGWGLQIEVAPRDPRYPQLVRLCDPVYVRALLAACAPPAAGDYAVTTIRYRPGQRHVLRYSPAAGDGAGEGAGEGAGAGPVFAKLYRPRPEGDGSLRALCAMTGRLADWLEACTPDATVLRPAAYVAADTAILYPWVDGVPLAELCRCGAAEAAPLLAQAGAALRGLHAAPAEITQGLAPQELGEELKAVAKTCEHIQVLLPAVGHAIDGLLGGVARAYAALPQEAPTLIHGDFKADHVLVAPGARRGRGAALTLIDFDSCRVADPALDIGKFLADLDWAYARCDEEERVAAQAAFLGGYGLDPAHPRLQRARVVEALILVKITAHRVKLFDLAWSLRTWALVAQAQSVLDAATAGGRRGPPARLAGGRGVE